MTKDSTILDVGRLFADADRHRRTRMHWHLPTRALSLFVFLSALAWTSFVCFGQEKYSDGKYLKGLRRRQLFQLAESYCNKRLADSRLSIAQRADLTIHLSQIYADHARQTPPNEADPLWRKAVVATEEFARRYKQGNWPLVVRVQGALVPLSRGELARQRAQVSGAKSGLLATAREDLRKAIFALRNHSGQTAEALRTHRLPSKDLSREELLSLDRNVKAQLARAYRNQALCYPEDSADRANSLQQALEQLDGLAGLSTVDPLAWQARIEEIVCLRLMKQFSLADRRLAKLEQDRPPPRIQLRARAERVRWLLAKGRTGEAIKSLQSGRAINGLSEPEYDYAHLEAYLAAWRAADKAMDVKSAAAYQAAALEFVRIMERQYAPYWARRAEGMLASVIADAGLEGNLAVLVRAAQGFYRGKQIEDALRTYDKAVAMARDEGDDAKAFELAYTAAAIEHDRKIYPAAARRFRQLALKQPNHEQAGEAHLLAIFNAAQHAKRQKPVKLDEYAALLREHLATWPSSATADQARTQLGQLYEYKRRWGDAVAVYRDVNPGHQQYAASVKATARCYDALLAELRGKNESTFKLASEAASYFERLVLPGENPRWPERWSETERFAALAACRLRLDHALGENSQDQQSQDKIILHRAEQFLTRSLRGQPPPPLDWNLSAQSLLVVVRAGQGEYDKASLIVGDLSQAPPALLLKMLGRLAAMSETVPSDARRSLGGLQSLAVDLLSNRRSKLDKTSQKKLDIYQAHALAASGDAKKAAEMFGRLAKTFPLDGDLQEAHARVLLELSDRKSLQSALTKWREIERRSRPATPRWFRAKYHLALAYERLGNRTRAAQIIKVTQVLHPKLGGPKLKGWFLELLKHCQN